MNNLSNISQYTVTELNKSIKNIIESSFLIIEVSGEISDLKKHSSGHIYFTLKDEESSISSICWRSNVPKLNFEVEDGLSVKVKGKITTYSPQSKYQLIVEQIEHQGEGALLKILEKRKKKLLDEGIFDKIHKKELPKIPKTIGVITSESGSVIKDIIHRITDRFPLNIILFPAKVQGRECVKDVCEGIDFFNNFINKNLEESVDLVIIARGGGSLEDLMPFNDEEMVRKIFNSKIPVVSAVGHETDITLVDFVSDLRSPTPSAAAEMIVPDRKEILIRIKEKFSNIKNNYKKYLNQKSNSLELSYSKFPDLISIINSHSQGLDLINQKLSTFLEKIFTKKKISYLAVTRKFNTDILVNSINTTKDKFLLVSKRLVKEIIDLIRNKKLIFSSKEKQLNILSHRETLKRGFALVRKKEKIVSDDKQIQVKEKIEIEFFKSKTNVRKL